MWVTVFFGLVMLSMHHSEGVAIMLNPLMAASWRDSGEHSLPLAPRLYFAPLQLCYSDSNEVNFTIVSIYSIIIPINHLLR